MLATDFCMQEPLELLVTSQLDFGSDILTLGVGDSIPQMSVTVRDQKRMPIVQAPVDCWQTDFSVKQRLWLLNDIHSSGATEKAVNLFY